MYSFRRESVYQFVRFSLVGVSNTAVDFTTYLALTRLVPFFGSFIYIANTLSFIVAATWSYFANRTWTFKQQHKAHVGEAFKFYSATLLTFALSMATLYIVVDVLGEYDLIGKVIAAVVSMISNFTLNKLWVFNK
ncbi:MAG: GtrA family protein [Candidatus Paceibacter sp.]|nr:GtrA family protein [Candidatus Paceibacter sp.]